MPANPPDRRSGKKAILLVDDHPLMRRGLAALIGGADAAFDLAANLGIAQLPGHRVELAGLVAENEFQILFVGLGRGQLPRQDEKIAIDVLAFVECGQIGDVNVFHDGES